MTPGSLPSRRARLGAVALAAACVSGLAACGGGGSAGAKAAPHPVLLTLAAGPVSVEAAGLPAGSLSPQDRDAVVDVVRRYVTAGTIDPLRGQPVGELASLFSPDAVTGLTGPDRAALVDEGLPAATGQVSATAQPVALTALSNATGAIDLVGANLSLDVSARTARGPVTVKRSGELVLTHSAGGWKIESYRILVDRGGAGLGPATSASTTAGRT